MKFFLLSCTILLLLSGAATAQLDISPATQQKINQRIEAKAAVLKQKMEHNKENPVIIAFALDTFRAERAMDERIQLSSGDFNMRDAAYEGAKTYDSLLNKYYKKLLNLLKGDDKKVLVQAQKAWLLYRDNENQLTGIISKDAYSGGGTMQQLTESAEYLNLVKSRTLLVFAHYARATQSY